jgi:hypothetical protein
MAAVSVRRSVSAACAGESRWPRVFLVSRSSAAVVLGGPQGVDKVGCLGMGRGEFSPQSAPTAAAVTSFTATLRIGGEDAGQGKPRWPTSAATCSRTVRSALVHPRDRLWDRREC